MEEIFSNPLSHSTETTPQVNLPYDNVDIKEIDDGESVIISRRFPFNVNEEKRWLTCSCITENTKASIEREVENMQDKNIMEEYLRELNKAIMSIYNV